MEEVKIALINTVLIILAIILIGRLLDTISSGIIKFLAKNFGTAFALLFANRLTFIGTIYHELSHMIVLIITGAKITKLELFKPKGDRLGQVKYINRGNFIFKSIQNTLSAIAPVFFGCAAIYLIYNQIINCNSIYLIILLVYMLVSILLHTTMSNQDLKMAIKGLPICFLLLFIVMYITKLNIIELI